jgi:AP-1-like factor
MASAGTGGSLPPNFLLTPQQQSLLFAALNSNRQSNTVNNPPSASPAVFNAAGAPASGEPNGFNDTPFLDNLDNLDYTDFGDSSFDFSFANGDQSLVGDTSTVGVKSESPENDAHEKRSHPDDEEGTPVESESKRRESAEKVPKKPGRKPLTSEPSSVRPTRRRTQESSFVC